MPDLIDGQAQTLIANHLKNVAMAAAVCDVDYDRALVYLGGVGQGLLILYKAYERACEVNYFWGTIYTDRADPLRSHFGVCLRT